MKKIREEENVALLQQPGIWQSISPAYAIIVVASLNSRRFHRVMAYTNDALQVLELVRGPTY